MEVNPNSPQSNGSSNALGNIQRPGDYLRQIRITQKRELSDVAKELNIPLKTLTALEQDEYTALPEATFIKGYYRTYAKFLKVDATTIIQRFDDIYANDTGLLSIQLGKYWQQGVKLLHLSLLVSLLFKFVLMMRLLCHSA